MGAGAGLCRRRRDVQRQSDGGARRPPASLILPLPHASSIVPPVPAALFFRLKEHGFEKCKAYSVAYADCCRGRVFSMAWACRKQMHELSDCMSTQ